MVCNSNSFCNWDKWARIKLLISYTRVYSMLKNCLSQNVGTSFNKYRGNGYVSLCLWRRTVICPAADCCARTFYCNCEFTNLAAHVPWPRDRMSSLRASGYLKYWTSHATRLPGRQTGLISSGIHVDNNLLALYSIDCFSKLLRWISGPSWSKTSYLTSLIQKHCRWK